MDGLPNLLTPEAREAIASGVGPLFEAMIVVTMRDNPDLNTHAAANDGLQQLLGPRCIEELFLPMRVALLPCVVKLRGAEKRILETDPYLYTMRVAAYRIVRKLISEQFGGINGLRHLRTAYTAEGGYGEDFNRYLINRYHAMLADLNARARLVANTVSSVPALDAFEEWRESQGIWPTIHVSPGKVVAEKTACVAPREQPQSVDAPAYPPIWSQAHTLPQIVIDPTPALKSGDWPWRRVARWMYNWRSWLALVVVFSSLEVMTALGKFRLARHTSQVSESAVAVFWLATVYGVGVTVAIGYGYAKLFTNPNRARRVVLYAYITSALVGLMAIGFGLFGLDSNSSLAKNLQLRGCIALAFGLLMVRLSQPLARLQFAQLAQMLNDLHRHGVPHSLMPEHGGGKQRGRYVVKPYEPRERLPLWKICRQVVTGKIVLPSEAD